MKKDILFAQAIKKIDVVSSVAMCQAQGTLKREFNITSRTAAKATDRIFNGTTNKQGEKVAPLLCLSQCKTSFVDVDHVEWQKKQDILEAKEKAQKSGVLVYLSSARHKKFLNKSEDQ
jgi:hypothetical protein